MSEHRSTPDSTPSSVDPRDGLTELAGALAAVEAAVAATAPTAAREQGPQADRGPDADQGTHADPHPEGSPHYGYMKNKADYLARLRRIEGQARGLQRMVEEDKYCIDILTQVSAMTSALRSFALGILEEHINHCVAGAIAVGGEEADAKVKEALEAVSRLVRS